MMIKWEPIVLDNVQVGDRISDVDYSDGYIVTEIWEHEARKYCHIRFSDGNIHEYPLNVFRYTKSVGLDYDPKQQPYTEDDI
jgi:hypothetical protein